MIRSCWPLLIILFLLLSGCAFPAAQPVTPSLAPTLQNIRLAQVQVTPSATATVTPAPELTETPTAAPTTAVFTCDAAPDTAGDPFIRHLVAARIDYPNRTITAEQTVHYTNPTTSDLADIVLNVEPNERVGVFTLESVQIEDSEPDYTLARNRLQVELPAPLAPGCELELRLRFQMRIPRIDAGISSLRGFFGYSDRQINLALWLPTVAPRVNDQWIVHEPLVIGEQIVLEIADWELLLDVENAPAGLQVAVPGQVEQLDDARWRIVHRRSRDLSLSLSPFYKVTRQQAADGTVVELYSFSDTIVTREDGTFDGSVHTLEEATRSLEVFVQRFGPYPYDRMLVVQGDFPDGMEFSGLVFVSSAWFYYFDGQPTNYLTLITVHEVAHQWWYARVGNDSAMAPWLDEALATYSEYVYFEEQYPALKDWWWTFRVANFYPQGTVDSTVYEFSTLREYINAVYLRGVQMLHNLREDVGSDAFFALLKDYVTAGDGRIVTPQLFWQLLPADHYASTDQTRREFFREPDFR